MYSQPPATAVTPVEHRILRRSEVEAKTGFKRAHIYSLIKEGEFPRPLRLGVRAVGWDSVEIDQWITARLKRRAHANAVG
jgi:prophage regulatory protein